MGNMFYEALPLDLIALFQFLFPGFITLVLLYNLTSYSKPSSFKKISLVLVFTGFNQLLLKSIEWILKLFKIGIETGQWDNLQSLIFTILISVFLALLLSYFANNDKFHTWLRSLNITRETSFPSELFGSVLDKSWIVLHFKDSKRLYGWLVEWPSESKNGHFLIRYPSWLDDNNIDHPIDGINDILIKAEDVRWIEFAKEKE